MKATGIVRRIDDLGRIIIPKDVRRQIFGTTESAGEPMEIFVDKGNIVLTPYKPEAENTRRDELLDKLLDWLEEHEQAKKDFLQHEQKMADFFEQHSGEIKETIMKNYRL